MLVYVAKARREMVSGDLASFHSCFGMRRIWAQNPSDAGPAAVKSEVVVENVA